MNIPLYLAEHPDPAVQALAERLDLLGSLGEHDDTYYDLLAVIVQERDHFKREYEERLRVNVGLLRENDDLKRKLAGQ